MEGTLDSFLQGVLCSQGAHQLAAGLEGMGSHPGQVVVGSRQPAAELEGVGSHQPAAELEGVGSQPEEAHQVGGPHWVEWLEPQFWGSSIKRDIKMAPPLSPPP